MACRSQELRRRGKGGEAVERPRSEFLEHKGTIADPRPLHADHKFFPRSKQRRRKFLSWSIILSGAVFIVACANQGARGRGLKGFN